jgi:hypothetical protein
VAFRLPLVVASGQRQQLQAGDTLLVGALSVSGGVLDAYAGSGVVIGGGADPGGSCLRVGNDVYLTNHLYFETASGGAAWIGTQVAGVPLRFGVGGSEVARFTPSGSFNIVDTNDLGSGILRCLTVMNTAVTGDKIILFNPTYGIGINTSELAFWSNGIFNFRSASRTGTLRAQIGSLGSFVSATGVFQPFDAAGTDIAGTSVTIRGGLGTGAGSPGPIVFAVSDPIATGATVQSTAVERMRVDQSRVTISETSDDTLKISAASDAVGTRFGIYIRNTLAGGQSNIWLDNNRGSFASYGGMIYGGSTNAVGNLFGVSRADKLIIMADGASNLGMVIGTHTSQPVIFGANNSETMRLTPLGGLNIGGTTDPGNNRLQLTSADGTGTNFIIKDTTSTGTPVKGLELWSTVSQAAFQLSGNDLQILNYTATGILALGVNSITRLTITAAGGVYIGGGTPSTDPGSSNLTVAGVIKTGAALPTQVVGARKTGWTAATGTATRTAFATSTVTTAALAQAVKALIDDLISHGLIGA